MGEGKLLALIGIGCISTLPALAQSGSPTEYNDTISNQLDELVVKSASVRKMNGAMNTTLITSAELKRAACCNLGESFTTNPSVDVNYTDAATGARQIKLLGLSGSYVQMLTENIPNFRGTAAPYGLGYIPGPWMQSIQVSKGASSVKNGFESITGQINVEMRKPQLEPSLQLNAYYDSMNKLEANASGNMKFGPRWSGGILTHFENEFNSHDSDGDGFSDFPQVKQFSVMPRTAYMGENYVFQGGAKLLTEDRKSGQLAHSKSQSLANPYTIGIKTDRAEAFTKNAYIFDSENDGNVAMILSGSYHKQDAHYGNRVDNIIQKDLYSSLMFERKWTSRHSLSTGLSFAYDDYDFSNRLGFDKETPLAHESQKEGVAGAYAQYTYNLDDRLVAMAGIREDWSNQYGAFFTPRMHLRYNPTESLAINASAGKGSRTPHPLAEYSYMLASSRQLDIAKNLKRESAWNYGVSATWSKDLFDRPLQLSGEYYYTDFNNYLTLDLDTDPHKALIYSSSGKSYSHALQFELSYQPIEDLQLTAAWRFTDVKADYEGLGLLQKPLTSRHKGLFTLGWSPNMGIWQIDASLALNGGGRMPAPYRLADGPMSWNRDYKGYAGLNAQITRNFRNWSVYLGGENLTNFRQPNPIIGAADPWGSNFDATMIYGPLKGAMIYAGFRFNITKYN